MKKTHFISALLLLAAVSSSAFAAKPVICEGPYVLCAYAKCIPMPDKKDKALCTCEVKSGYSIGSTSCQTKPAVIVNDFETLDSRYFPVKKYVSCHNDRTWANCYNAKCVINPKDKSQAFCTCGTVKNKGDYMLANDSCDKTDCETGMISSYVIKDAVSEYDSLKTVTNFDKLPSYSPTLCTAN